MYWILRLFPCRHGAPLASRRGPHRQTVRTADLAVVRLASGGQQDASRQSCCGLMEEIGADDEAEKTSGFRQASGGSSGGDAEHGVGHLGSGVCCRGRDRRLDRHRSPAARRRGCPALRVPALFGMCVHVLVRSGRLLHRLVEQHPGTAAEWSELTATCLHVEAELHGVTFRRCPGGPTHRTPGVL